jgi:hypothetical protein
MTKSVSHLRRKQLIEGIRDISGLKTDAEIINAALEEYARILAGRSIINLKGKVTWEGDLNKMRAIEYADTTF